MQSKYLIREINRRQALPTGGWRIGLAALLCALLLPVTAAAQTFQECGTLENAYGPFDYTNPLYTVRQPGKGDSPLHLVEGAHFTPEVEALIRGKSSTNALDDLEYTLRVFPNHHRALNSMANYYLQNGMQKHGRYTIECWFDRAIRFKPNDGNVRLVYGIFLSKKGDQEQALEQYKQALALMPDSAEAHYNIALLYTDMKDYDNANRHAVRAYELGFPLPWLRNRLEELNVWNPDGV